MRMVVLVRTLSLLAVAMSSPPARAEGLLVEGRTFDGDKTTPLVLTGAQSGSVIRGCVFRNMPEAAIAISGASDVLIEGCHFESIRSGRPDKDTHAIVCGARGRRITIRRCTFVDIGADGIQMGHGGVDIRDVRILDNDFRVTNEDVGENGVDLKTVQGPVLVAGNRFHGFRPADGRTQDATGSNGEGMVVHKGAVDVTIERNRFFDNHIGLKVQAGTGRKPTDRPPVGIVVRDNWFYDNRHAGLLAYRVHSLRLVNNTFLDNGVHVSAKEAPVEGGACVNRDNLFAGAGGGFDAWDARDNGVYRAEEAGFVDLAGRDLRLRADSPARGRGASPGGTAADGDARRPPKGSGSRDTLGPGGQKASS